MDEVTDCLYEFSGALRTQLTLNLVCHEVFLKTCIAAKVLKHFRIEKHTLFVDGSVFA